MRKAIWTALGITGLSLMVCGSAEAQGTSAPAAQAPAGARPTGAGPDAAGGRLRAGEAPSQPPLEVNAAEAEARAGLGGAQAREVADLQTEVVRLRAELAQLRAEVAELRGTGGSGTEGMGEGTGGSGGGGEDAAGAGTGGSGGGGGRTDAQRGGSEAAAIYTGTVEDVRSDRIVLTDEDGTSLVFHLGDRTRVLRNGRSVPVRQLQEGTRVRASVDLLSAGRNQVTEIVVLSSGGPAR